MPCLTYTPTSITGYQCDLLSPLHSHGSRGITYWGYPNGTIYTIPPGGEATITFTGTEPKCYQGKDSCNLLFNAYANNTSSGSDITVKLSVNEATNIGGFELSRITNHGAWQAIEIGPDLGGYQNYYHDTGLNTLKFTNQSNDSTVTIANFQIIRVYQMCNLGCNGGDCFVDKCNGTDLCTTGGCSIGTNPGTLGNLDTLRVDYPCNYPTTGQRSFTKADFYFNSLSPPKHTLQPGQCKEFIFNWSPTYTTDASYVGKEACLFNFNQLMATFTDNRYNDIPLVPYLNNTPYTTFYLSNQASHSVYASYNIGTLSNYNDTGPNTVKIENAGNIPVIFNDESGVDVYRVYKTSPVSLNIEATAGPGGSISPAGTVPVAYDGYQVFTITPNTGYQIDSVYVDGQTVGPPYGGYTFNGVITHHHIDAYFESCGTCQTVCQATCQLSCQSCMSACDVSCQTGCEISCQVGCEVSCQTGCQLCQTACELSCQTSCEAGCQTACELNCQDCQTACELNCQTACQVCETCDYCEACYSSCQDACQLSCQNCQGACQVGCEVSCQTECELGCLTCQTCDAWGCQGGCQGGCQTACEITCQTCQTGCQVSCQETCQVSCQEGCYNCYYCASCLYCQVAGYL